MTELKMTDYLALEKKSLFVDKLNSLFNLKDSHKIVNITEGCFERGDFILRDYPQTGCPIEFNNYPFSSELNRNSMIIVEELTQK